MSKIYFEMSEAERQLTHIRDGLDYATCLIGEGISGDYQGVSVNMLIDLQSNIVNHLTMASRGVEMLLNAVKPGKTA